MNTGKLSLARSNANESTLVRILFALFLTIAVQGRCVLYQPSETIKAREAQTEEEKTPTLYPENTGVCDDYVGKMVCCNEAARNLMLVNFAKLLFSSPCQTCLNNIKRFL